MKQNVLRHFAASDASGDGMLSPSEFAKFFALLVGDKERQDTAVAVLAPDTPRKPTERVGHNQGGQAAGGDALVLKLKAHVENLGVTADMIDQVLSAFDTGNSGCISVTQFAQVLDELYFEQSASEVELLVATVGTNGTGEIVRDELTRRLRLAYVDPDATTEPSLGSDQVTNAAPGYASARRRRDGGWSP